MTKPSFTPRLAWVGHATGQMTSEAQRILRALLDIVWNRTGLESSKVVTGTAGASGRLAEWDANGDLIGAAAATGTGAPVRATSPTLVTPALGTPSAVVLTNATGLPLATGVNTFSSADLRGRLSDETGGGAAVFADTPTLITPVLGAATATSINFGQTSLNYYETGTWTPALLFGGAAVGMTGTFAGTYTRIGRLTFERATITLTAKGSSTGNATITGLAFSAGSSSAAWIGQAALFTGLSGALQAFVTTATITLRQSGAAGNTTITDAVFQNTTTFQTSVAFEV